MRCSIGGEGPKTLALAATPGDGTVLTSALTEEQIRRSIATVRDANGRRPHEIVAHLVVTRGPDAEDLLAAELSEWPAAKSPRGSPHESPGMSRPAIDRCPPRHDDGARPQRRRRSRTRSPRRVGRPRGRAPGVRMTARFVMAIDQGTTSTRAIVFDHAGELVGTGQREHEQHLPAAPAGSSTTPIEICDNVARGDRPRRWMRRARQPRDVAADRHHQPARDRRRLGPRAPASRSTTRSSGRTPARSRLVDALAADGGVDRFREQTGLPLATYFSATKIAWILDNVDGRRATAPRPASCCSAPPTPGCSGTSPAAPAAASTSPTSPTPAARCSWTCATLDWDDELLEAFGIPRSMLPEIRSSSGGLRRGRVADARCRGVPIAGILGDQQAATFGQAAFDAGRVEEHLRHGQLPARQHRHRDRALARTGCITTVALPARRRARVYALEGSIAVTGRSSSGCATTSASSTTRPRSRQLAAIGRRQRRRVLRAGVLRAVRAVLAARCPRRDRRPHPLRRTRATSPARRSRRRRSRPARCSMR